MELRVLETSSHFDAVRADWDAVYAADRHASIFLSWPWLSRWLAEVRAGWFILAVHSRARNRYVAFLPLRVGTEPLKGGGFYSVLKMAGNNFADYTGAIADPDYAEEAFELFGQAIAEMNWAMINFGYVRDDSGGLDRLMRQISLQQCNVSRDRREINAAEIDNTISPYVELHQDWDAYLSGLSSNMRQKIRRLLRREDNVSDLRITETTVESLDRDVEILMALWMARWGHLKGNGKDAIDRTVRRMLKHYMELGILHLPVIWLDDRPMAAHASLIDREKRRMHFYIGGRDEEFSRYQPGLTLHAFSIRQAIGMNLQEYDLLRGNEPYKFTLGAKTRQLRNVNVKIKSTAERRTKVLHRQSIPAALQLINTQLADGDVESAEIGFRQILQLDKNCTPALAGIARIRRGQGAQSRSASAL